MVNEKNHAFFIPLTGSFFSEVGQHFSIHDIKQPSLLPFKDHVEWPHLVDTLQRLHQHHLVLHVDFSTPWYPAFFEALLVQLHREDHFSPLRQAELIYFDSLPLILNKAKQQAIKKSFQALRESLDQSSHCLLLAFSSFALLKRDLSSRKNRFLYRQFETLLTHPRCRFLLLSPQLPDFPYDQEHFASLSFSAPTAEDGLHWLKEQRNELEAFHQVLIPDDLLKHAFLLAQRYLSAHSPWTQAARLLDSGAARLSETSHGHAPNLAKPALTHTLLAHVLSEWTHLPVSAFLFTKFKPHEFIQGMQQRLFNQEAAITLLGQELQQAHSQLLQASGPFCKFLFAGAPHSGKKAAALALAEQLFKHLGVLYTTTLPSTSPSSLADIRLERVSDHCSLTLKEVVYQTPYAILLFEHIEHASPTLLDSLQEISRTGYLYDTEGRRHSFQQAIVILTLNLNDCHLQKGSASEEETPEVDLRHLVMNEYKPHLLHHAPYHAPHDLAATWLNDLSAYLPHSLCQELTVVPFVPLNQTALEKIIRQKLNQLSELLNTRYDTAMSYAPEVLRYLVHSIWTKREMTGKTLHLEPALKQIYFVVEQAILQQENNKQASHQLFLQLDETGELLRCDWLTMTAVS